MAERLDAIARQYFNIDEDDRPPTGTGGPPPLSVLVVQHHNSMVSERPVRALLPVALDQRNPNVSNISSAIASPLTLPPSAACPRMHGGMRVDASGAQTARPSETLASRLANSFSSGTTTSQPIASTQRSSSTGASRSRRVKPISSVLPPHHENNHSSPPPPSNMRRTHSLGDSGIGATSYRRSDGAPLDETDDAGRGDNTMEDTDLMLLPPFLQHLRDPRGLETLAFTRYCAQRTELLATSASDGSAPVDLEGVEAVLKAATSSANTLATYALSAAARKPFPGVSVIADPVMSAHLSVMSSTTARDNADAPRRLCRAAVGASAGVLRDPFTFHKVYMLDGTGDKGDLECSESSPYMTTFLASSIAPYPPILQQQQQRSQEYFMNVGPREPSHTISTRSQQPVPAKLPAVGPGKELIYVYANYVQPSLNHSGNSYMQLPRQYQKGLDAIALLATAQNQLLARGVGATTATTVTATATSAAATTISGAVAAGGATVTAPSGRSPRGCAMKGNPLSSVKFTDTQRPLQRRDGVARVTVDLSPSLETTPTPRSSGSRSSAQSRRAGASGGRRTAWTSTTSSLHRFGGGLAGGEYDIAVNQRLAAAVRSGAYSTLPTVMSISAEGQLCSTRTSSPRRRGEEVCPFPPAGAIHLGRYPHASSGGGGLGAAQRVAGVPNSSTTGASTVQVFNRLVQSLIRRDEKDVALHVVMATAPWRFTTSDSMRLVVCFNHIRSCLPSRHLATITLAMEAWASLLRITGPSCTADHIRIAEQLISDILNYLRNGSTYAEYMTGLVAARHIVARRAAPYRQLLEERLPSLLMAVWAVLLLLRDERGNFRGIVRLREVAAAALQDLFVVALEGAHFVVAQNIVANAVNLMLQPQPPESQRPLWRAGAAQCTEVFSPSEMQPSRALDLHVSVSHPNFEFCNNSPASSPALSRAARDPVAQHLPTPASPTPAATHPSGAQQRPKSGSLWSAVRQSLRSLTSRATRSISQPSHTTTTTTGAAADGSHRRASVLPAVPGDERLGTPTVPAFPAFPTLNLSASFPDAGAVPLREYLTTTLEPARPISSGSSGERGGVSPPLRWRPRAAAPLGASVSAPHLALGEDPWWTTSDSHFVYDIPTVLSKLPPPSSPDTAVIAGSLVVGAFLCAWRSASGGRWPLTSEAANYPEGVVPTVPRNHSIGVDTPVRAPLSQLTARLPDMGADHGGRVGEPAPLPLSLRTLDDPVTVRLLLWAQEAAAAKQDAQGGGECVAQVRGGESFGELDDNELDPQWRSLRGEATNAYSPSRISQLFLNRRRLRVTRSNSGSGDVMQGTAVESATATADNGISAAPAGGAAASPNHSPLEMPIRIPATTAGAAARGEEETEAATQPYLEYFLPSHAAKAIVHLCLSSTKALTPEVTEEKAGAGRDGPPSAPEDRASAAWPSLLLETSVTMERVLPLLAQHYGSHFCAATTAGLMQLLTNRTIAWLKRRQMAANLRGTYEVSNDHSVADSNGKDSRGRDGGWVDSTFSGIELLTACLFMSTIATRRPAMFEHVFSRQIAPILYHALRHGTPTHNQHALSSLTVAVINMPSVPCARRLASLVERLIRVALLAPFDVELSASVVHIGRVYASLRELAQKQLLRRIGEVLAAPSEGGQARAGGAAAAAGVFAAESPRTVYRKRLCFRVLRLFPAVWGSTAAFFLAVCTPYFHHRDQRLRRECVDATVQLLLADCLQPVDVDVDEDGPVPPHDRPRQLRHRCVCERKHVALMTSCRLIEDRAGSKGRAPLSGLRSVVGGGRSTETSVLHMGASPMVSLVFERHSGVTHINTLKEVLKKLVEVAVCDPEVAIRLSALRSLTPETYQFLYAHESIINNLFVVLNDTHLPNRVEAVRILRHLAPHNTSMIYPRLRKVFLEELEEPRFFLDTHGAGIAYSGTSTAAATKTAVATATATNSTPVPMCAERIAILIELTRALTHSTPLYLPQLLRLLEAVLINSSERHAVINALKLLTLLNEDSFKEQWDLFEPFVEIVASQLNIRDGDVPRVLCVIAALQSILQSSEATNYSPSKLEGIVDTLHSLLYQRPSVGSAFSIATLRLLGTISSIEPLQPDDYHRLPALLRRPLTQFKLPNMFTFVGAGRGCGSAIENVGSLIAAREVVVPVDGAASDRAGGEQDQFRQRVELALILRHGTTRFAAFTTHLWPDMVLRVLQRLVSDFLGNTTSFTPEGLRECLLAVMRLLSDTEALERLEMYLPTFLSTVLSIITSDHHQQQQQRQQHRLSGHLQAPGAPGAATPSPTLAAAAATRGGSAILSLVLPWMAGLVRRANRRITPMYHLLQAFLLQTWSGAPSVVRGTCGVLQALCEVVPDLAKSECEQWLSKLLELLLSYTAVKMTAGSGAGSPTLTGGGEGGGVGGVKEHGGSGMILRSPAQRQPGTTGGVMAGGFSATAEHCFMDAGVGGGATTPMATPVTEGPPSRKPSGGAGHAEAVDEAPATSVSLAEVYGVVLTTLAAFRPLATQEMACMVCTNLVQALREVPLSSTDVSGRLLTEYYSSSYLGGGGGRAFGGAKTHDRHSSMLPAVADLVVDNAEVLSAGVNRSIANVLVDYIVQCDLSTAITAMVTTCLHHLERLSGWHMGTLRTIEVAQQDHVAHRRSGGGDEEDEAPHHASTTPHGTWTATQRAGLEEQLMQLRANSDAACRENEAYWCYQSPMIRLTAHHTDASSLSTLITRYFPFQSVTSSWESFAEMDILACVFVLVGRTRLRGVSFAMPVTEYLLRRFGEDSAVLRFFRCITSQSYEVALVPVELMTPERVTAILLTPTVVTRFSTSEDAAVAAGGGAAHAQSTQQDVRAGPPVSPARGDGGSIAGRRATRLHYGPVPWSIPAHLLPLEGDGTGPASSSTHTYLRDAHRITGMAAITTTGHDDNDDNDDNDDDGHASPTIGPVESSSATEAPYARLVLPNLASPSATDGSPIAVTVSATRSFAVGSLDPLRSNGDSPNSLNLDAWGAGSMTTAPTTADTPSHAPRGAIQCPGSPQQPPNRGFTTSRTTAIANHVSVPINRDIRLPSRQTATGSFSAQQASTAVPTTTPSSPIAMSSLDGTSTTLAGSMARTHILGHGTSVSTTTTVTTTVTTFTTATFQQQQRAHTTCGVGVRDVLSSADNHSLSSPRMDPAAGAGSATGGGAAGSLTAPFPASTDGGTSPPTARAGPGAYDYVHMYEFDGEHGGGGGEEEEEGEKADGARLLEYFNSHKTLRREEWRRWFEGLCFRLVESSPAYCVQVCERLVKEHKRSVIYSELLPIALLSNFIIMSVEEITGWVRALRDFYLYHRDVPQLVATEIARIGHFIRLYSAALFPEFIHKVVLEHITAEYVSFVAHRALHPPLALFYCDDEALQEYSLRHAYRGASYYEDMNTLYNRHYILCDPRVQKLVLSTIEPMNPEDVRAIAATGTLTSVFEIADLVSKTLGAEALEFLGCSCFAARRYMEPYTASLSQPPPVPLHNRVASFTSHQEGPTEAVGIQPESPYRLASSDALCEGSDRDRAAQVSSPLLQGSSAPPTTLLLLPEHVLGAMRSNIQLLDFEAVLSLWSKVRDRPFYRHQHHHHSGDSSDGCSLLTTPISPALPKTTPLMTLGVNAQPPSIPVASLEKAYEIGRAGPVPAIIASYVGIAAEALSRWDVVQEVTSYVLSESSGTLAGSSTHDSFQRRPLSPHVGSGAAHWTGGEGATNEHQNPQWSSVEEAVELDPFHSTFYGLDSSPDHGRDGQSAVPLRRQLEIFRGAALVASRQFDKAKAVLAAVRESLRESYAVFYTENTRVRLEQNSIFQQISDLEEGIHAIEFSTLDRDGRPKVGSRSAGEDAASILLSADLSPLAAGFGSSEALHHISTEVRGHVYKQSTIHRLKNIACRSLPMSSTVLQRFEMIAVRSALVPPYWQLGNILVLCEHIEGVGLPLRSALTLDHFAQLRISSPNLATMQQYRQELQVERYRRLVRNLARPSDLRELYADITVSLRRDLAVCASAGMEVMTSPDGCGAEDGLYSHHVAGSMLTVAELPSSLTRYQVDLLLINAACRRRLQRVLDSEAAVQHQVSAHSTWEAPESPTSSFISRHFPCTPEAGRRAGGGDRGTTHREASFGTFTTAAAAEGISGTQATPSGATDEDITTESALLAEYYLLEHTISVTSYVPAVWREFGLLLFDVCIAIHAEWELTGDVETLDNFVEQSTKAISALQKAAQLWHTAAHEASGGIGPFATSSHPRRRHARGALPATHLMLKALFLAVRCEESTRRTGGAAAGSGANANLFSASDAALLASPLLATSDYMSVSPTTAGSAGSSSGGGGGSPAATLGQGFAALDFTRPTFVHWAAIAPFLINAAAHHPALYEALRDMCGQSRVLLHQVIFILIAVFEHPFATLFSQQQQQRELEGHGGSPPGASYHNSARLRSSDRSSPMSCFRTASSFDRDGIFQGASSHPATFIAATGPLSLSDVEGTATTVATPFYYAADGVWTGAAEIPEVAYGVPLPPPAASTGSSSPLGSSSLHHQQQPRGRLHDRHHHHHHQQQPQDRVNVISTLLHSLAATGAYHHAAITDTVRLCEFAQRRGASRVSSRELSLEEGHCKLPAPLWYLPTSCFATVATDDSDDERGGDQHRSTAATGPASAGPVANSKTATPRLRLMQPKLFTQQSVLHASRFPLKHAAPQYATEEIITLFLSDGWSVRLHRAIEAPFALSSHDGAGGTKERAGAVTALGSAGGRRLYHPRAVRLALGGSTDEFASGEASASVGMAPSEEAGGGGAFFSLAADKCSQRQKRERPPREGDAAASLYVRPLAIMECAVSFLVGSLPFSHLRRPLILPVGLQSFLTQLPDKVVRINSWHDSLPASLRYDSTLTNSRAVPSSLYFHHVEYEMHLQQSAAAAAPSGSMCNPEDVGMSPDADPSKTAETESDSNEHATSPLSPHHRRHHSREHPANYISAAVPVDRSLATFQRLVAASFDTGDVAPLRFHVRSLLLLLLPPQQRGDDAALPPCSHSEDGDGGGSGIGPPAPQLTYLPRTHHYLQSLLADLDAVDQKHAGIIAQLEREAAEEKEAIRQLQRPDVEAVREGGPVETAVVGVAAAANSPTEGRPAMGALSGRRRRAPVAISALSLGDCVAVGRLAAARAELRRDMRLAVMRAESARSEGALQRAFYAESVDTSHWAEARQAFSQELAEWSVAQYLLDAHHRECGNIFVDITSGHVGMHSLASHALQPAIKLYQPSEVLTTGPSGNAEAEVCSRCVHQFDSDAAPRQDHTCTGSCARQVPAVMQVPFPNTDPTIFRLTRSLIKALPMESPFNIFEHQASKTLYDTFEFVRDTTGITTFGLDALFSFAYRQSGATALTLADRAGSAVYSDSQPPLSLALMRASDSVNSTSALPLPSLSREASHVPGSFTVTTTGSQSRLVPPPPAPPMSAEVEAAPQHHPRLPTLPHVTTTITPSLSPLTTGGAPVSSGHPQSFVAAGADSSVVPRPGHHPAAAWTPPLPLPLSPPPRCFDCASLRMKLARDTPFIILHDAERDNRMAVMAALRLRRGEEEADVRQACARRCGVDSGGSPTAATMPPSPTASFTRVTPPAEPDHDATAEVAAAKESVKMAAKSAYALVSQLIYAATDEVSWLGTAAVPHPWLRWAPQW